MELETGWCMEDYGGMWERKCIYQKQCQLYYAAALSIKCIKKLLQTA